MKSSKKRTKKEISYKPNEEIWNKIGSLSSSFMNRSALFFSLFALLFIFPKIAFAQKWGDIADKGCTKKGYKTYYAKLWDIPWGMSWEDACENTSVFINGVKVNTTSRCINRGSDGMWGEWDIADNSCLANWGGIANKGCTKKGYKTYYAKLYNVPPGQSWENACSTTSIEINGNKISTPSRCVNRGSDGFWGEWDIPDNDCTPNWGDIADKGCNGTGTRLYSARLWNVPSEEKWEEVCNSTPVRINGQLISEPTRCKNEGSEGIWGEWDIPDNTCGVDGMHWGDVNAKDCSKPGYRIYSAILWDIPVGQDWEEACSSMSVTIDGKTYNKPTRCVEVAGREMWGEWDVPDNTCGISGSPMVSLETNYYYRLEMKKSLIIPYKESLKIDNTGTARFSSPIGAGKRSQKEKEAEKLQEEDFDVFYDWLFVPTGVEGEYWMFNRGAQGGSGEVLTLPQGKKEFGQWELIEDVEVDSYEPDDDENRQKFILQDEGDGYYTLRLRYRGKNERENVLVANSSYANPGVGIDDAYYSNRLFKMVKREKASCDDILISSMLWNISDTIVQNYVLNLCKSEDASSPIPGPKALKLKKLVFINNKAGNNEIKIYKFGCLGEDILLSNGRATCEKMNFKSKGEVMVFKVDNYLRNSEKIWAVIGEGMFWTANVVLAGLTAGTSAPVSAGLTAGGIAANSIKTIIDVSNSENDTVTIVLGANHLGSSTFATVDAVTDAIPIEASAAGNIILLGLGGASIIEQGMSISDSGVPVSEDMFLAAFGFKEDINPQLESYIPQRFIMAIKNDAFTELMKDWTFTKNGEEYYDKVYYGGGVAYFFND